MEIARRRLLAFAGIAPLALGAATRALAEDAACYDPATLPMAQKNMRRSLGYTDSSTDPARHCGLCAFFSASQGQCGTCQLLNGGPVNAGALCTSFAAKSK